MSGIGTTTGGLVTVGETMALLTAAEPGPLRHAPTMRLGIGGAESNVAIGVRRLGCEAAWIGRVGDDELGELVLRTLRAEGVDVGGAIVDPGAPTSLMLKERRTATTARVTYYRREGPGARLCPADVDPERIRGADVLHLTGITPALSDCAGETVRVAAELARRSSVPVSLDFNYRSSLWAPDDAARALGDLCALVDVAFVGHSEARMLGYEGDALDVARAIQALGPTTVVVKLGRRGALALDNDDVSEVRGASVEAVDPVGAGDAFAAGYLSELLCGRSLLARLETAAACGAFAVSAYGDWEALPSRADLHLVSRPAGTVMR